MPSLYRFKYPSIIIIFFFFFITLLDSISRACYAGIPRLSIVTPVIFLLLSAAIAVVYIVAGIRLLRKVTSSGSQTGMSKRKQNLRRVNFENSVKIHNSGNDSDCFVCYCTCLHGACLADIFCFFKFSSCKSIPCMVACLWNSIYS